jgi:glycosyltransferase involved in cell wall biosynthesis
MENLMKISIAVPSYNYVKFLEDCLKSISQQNYSNFEVLIADGGSNDGSLDIIHRFCSEDVRFKLISTEDDGQADSIYKAFNQASGDILCFLNADDCYLDDKVFSRVIQDFTKNPNVSVLTYGGYYLDAEGSKIKKINYRYHPLDRFHWMKYRTAIIQPATFWLKNVYDPNKWPSEFHFVFDVVFFYAAYQKFSWLELSKPVAGYRLHGDNKSMTVRAGRIMELAAFEKIKFGQDSMRAHYLSLIGKLVRNLESLGSVGTKITKLIYLVVNSLAFITCYRLPSI